jgi:hypothetical protein
MKLSLYYLVPAHPNSTTLSRAKFHDCRADGGRINHYTKGRAWKVIYFTIGTISAGGKAVTLTEN